MIRFNYFLYAGFLLLPIAQVSAECRLTVTDTEDNKRIFTFRSGNKLHLLRVDVVPTGQDLEVFYNNGNVQKITCDQNGQFVPQLPLTIDTKTDLSMIVRSKQQPYCKHTMFLVGFKIQNEFLELYRSCFDETEQKADFSVHHLYNYSIDGIRDDVWKSGTIIKNGVEHSYKCKTTFDLFEALLGPGQTYIPNSKVCRAFDRGHLAPVVDFAFTNYRKATFKYINAVPQSANSNSGNWRVLETEVRNYLKNMPGGKYESLQICTGGIEVLQLLDKGNVPKEIYLYPGNPKHANPIPLNPAPRWIYKVVSHGGTPLGVFVSYNNIDKNSNPARICKFYNCPFLTKTFNNNNFYCCDPTEFINKYAQHCSPDKHDDQVPLQLFSSNPAIPKRTHNIPPPSTPVQKRRKG